VGLQSTPAAATRAQAGKMVILPWRGCAALGAAAAAGCMPHGGAPCSRARAAGAASRNGPLRGAVPPVRHAQPAPGSSALLALHVPCTNQQPGGWQSLKPGHAAPCSPAEKLDAAQQHLKTVENYLNKGFEFAKKPSTQKLLSDVGECGLFLAAWCARQGRLGGLWPGGVVCPAAARGWEAAASEQGCIRCGAGACAVHGVGLALRATGFSRGAWHGPSAAKLPWRAAAWPPHRAAGLWSPAFAVAVIDTATGAFFAFQLGKSVVRAQAPGFALPFFVCPALWRPVGSLALSTPSRYTVAALPQLGLIRAHLANVEQVGTARGCLPEPPRSCATSFWQPEGQRAPSECDSGSTH
jgi:hypothetical protein